MGTRAWQRLGTSKRVLGCKTLGGQRGHPTREGIIHWGGFVGSSSLLASSRAGLCHAAGTVLQGAQSALGIAGRDFGSVPT